MRSLVLEAIVLSVVLAAIAGGCAGAPRSEREAGSSSAASAATVTSGTAAAQSPAGGAATSGDGGGSSASRDDGPRGERPAVGQPELRDTNAGSRALRERVIEGEEDGGGRTEAVFGPADSMIVGPGGGGGGGGRCGGGGATVFPRYALRSVERKDPPSPDEAVLQHVPGPPIELPPPEPRPFVAPQAAGEPGEQHLLPEAVR